MTENPGQPQRVKSQDVRVITVEIRLGLVWEKMVQVIDGRLLVQTRQRFLQKGML